MEDARSQLVDKLKTANNILVTVSRDPSVDQLAALVGLTLLLNKQGKHAAAVFSGQIPSTLEFLKPEDTIEKNTDSLRDFIIALDKNKADKLRYKVEDDVVRIFITPYKTSISKQDFDFSQGDFNVDLVVAIGVRRQEDLDEAITAHGRILHDATVATINLTAEGGDLGTINWHADGSSLSELVTSVVQDIAVGQLDEQIATALLTGIVAETERFRNAKTSPQTMSVSATLMSAGANQQLVASKLEPADEAETPEDVTDEAKPDGSIEIDHQLAANASAVEQPEPEKPEAETSEEPLPESEAPSEPAPELDLPDPEPTPLLETTSPGSQLVTEPPTLGGTLTANSDQPKLDPVTDPLSLPNSEPPQLLDHKPDPLPPLSAQPATPAPTDEPDDTLTQLETSVDSPHLPQEQVDTARDEVSRALSQSPPPPEPITALNAQPMTEGLHSDAPPPVPPPIPFQFGNPPQPQ